MQSSPAACLPGAAPDGVIFYLAPEIPSASETFVFNEIAGLLKLGFEVRSFSVHRPRADIPVPAELDGRVRYLYTGPVWRDALAGLAGLASFGRHGLRSLGLLFSDMKACGLLRSAAWKLVFQFLAGARLAHTLKTEGARHLHVHFADVPAQIGMYAAHLAEVPFSITAHANDIFRNGLLLDRKVARAARTLTISEHNRSVLARMGMPPEKLALVRCAVDDIAAAPARPFEHRAIYRIGTLGRLVEKKGMDVLLRALARLPTDRYGVELVIGGDGPLRGDLETLARTLGIADRVRFVGAIAHREVAGWMRDLDVFVLACKRDRHGDMDGIPVVLMEAMAQYVPVVSTRLSGIPELVIDEETGLLARPDDPAELAEQLGRLLDEPRLRQQLAERAVAHVRREFSRETNLMRLVKATGIVAVFAVVGCDLL